MTCRRATSKKKRGSRRAALNLLFLANVVFRVAESRKRHEGEISDTMNSIPLPMSLSPPVAFRDTLSSFPAYLYSGGYIIRYMSSRGKSTLSRGDLFQRVKGLAEGPEFFSEIYTRVRKESLFY